MIVNGEIERPTPDEIAEIRRRNYAKTDQLIMDLSTNIKYPANLELQKIMHKTFVDILLAESGKEGDNLNRLTSKAVYLLCWLKRYLPFLFSTGRCRRSDVLSIWAGARMKMKRCFSGFSKAAGRCGDPLSEPEYTMPAYGSAVV